MSVAPSGRMASAIRRSIGSLRKPVRYATETGRVMYAASTRWLAIHALRRWRCPVPAAVKAPLVNAYYAHPVRAAGRADLDLVADSVTQHGLAQRRLVADPAGLGIGLGRPDDAVHLLVLTTLAEPDGAAHADLAGDAVLLDEDVVLDDHLELVDAGLFHALLVLGRVVLEVLGQVAQLARRLDLGRDLGPPDPRELVVLLAHGFQALRGDVDVFSHGVEFTERFLYIPRHEKAPADDRHAADGDGPGRRRGRSPRADVAGAARPGGRDAHLGGRRCAGHRAHGRRVQPLRQRGLGARGDSVRARRA